MGFSHRTCLPARRQRIDWGACKNTGVATYTASTGDSANASSRLLQAGTPYGSAFRESRVTIPTSLLRGSARIAGSTRLVVMSPMPMTNQRSIPSNYASSVGDIPVLHRRDLRLPSGSFDLDPGHLVRRQLRKHPVAQALSDAKILLGCQRQPEIRFLVVLCHAFSLAVQRAEPRLGRSVALFSRFH